MTGRLSKEWFEAQTDSDEDALVAFSEYQVELQLAKSAKERSRVAGIEYSR